MAVKMKTNNLLEIAGHLKKVGFIAEYNAKNECLEITTKGRADIGIKSMAILVDTGDSLPEGHTGISIDLGETDPYIVAVLINELSKVTDFIFYEPFYFSPFAQKVFYGKNAYEQKELDYASELESMIMDLTESQQDGQGFEDQFLRPDEDDIEEGEELPLGTLTVGGKKPVMH